MLLVLCCFDAAVVIFVVVFQDCFDWFFLITGITRTTSVVLNNFWFFCSTPLLFLFSLLMSTCVLTLFTNTFWHFSAELQRIFVLVVLDLQLETLCNCHSTFFALLMRSCVALFFFISIFVLIFSTLRVFLLWTLVATYGITGPIKSIFSFDIG